ncbi:MAG: serine hydrolase [Acinetobacter sp.]|nr:serine hydrolase [Acinetobacter sp.]
MKPALKWLHAIVATSLFGMSAMSHAEVVTKKTVWTEEEAARFLNQNQPASVPSTYNNSIGHATPSEATGYSNSTGYTGSPAGYEQPSVTARAALVMDANTGEVLYSKNTYQALPIASVTKVMTAMVVLDAGLDMNEQIILEKSDFSGANGKNSSSTLRVGDTMTRAEALLFALMKSENPAAVALSRTYPGGKEEFVAAMNQKAINLDMTSSRFYEASGLDVRNIANAQDLAKMVKAAVRYDIISKFSTTANYHFSLGQRQLASINTNRLVRDGAWLIQLSKTGYIRESGRCVVMQMKVNARPTIMVLLGSGEGQARTNDATKLYNWVAQMPQAL